MNVFAALQKAIGEELPNCVKFILTKSGYDTFAAIRCIRPESIQRIERFFNANMDKFLNDLIGSVYENMRTFQLNPGHSALIESLPQYLNSENQPAINENRSTFSQFYEIVD